MKRSIRFFTILFCLLSVLSLGVFWQEKPEKELYRDLPVLKAQRVSQDLGGKWTSYANLQDAWARENRVDQGYQDSAFSFLWAKSIVLPSDKRFEVAVKRFDITGNWGFKNAQIIIEGLYGRGRIFLNGIDEIHYLGELDGIGGIHSLPVNPTRFHNDKENVLYIELLPSSLQDQKMLGRLWSEKGRISGQIRLETLADTAIDPAKINLQYQSNNKQLIVGLSLRHQSLNGGPWAVQGTIKEGDREISECLLPISTNSDYQTSLDLIFQLPEGIPWQPNNPKLYDLTLAISSEGGEVDTIQMPVGFRTIEKLEDGTWMLNQLPQKVQGVILRQEEEWVVRNQKQMSSYLQKLQASGVNLIYFAGYFPDESWLYETDKIGMGVWLEAPMALVPEDVNPDHPGLDSLLAVSKRHPSVLAWTLARGLSDSTEDRAFLNKREQDLAPLPTYHLAFPSWREASLPGSLPITVDGLAGPWGQVQESVLVDPYPSIQTSLPSPYLEIVLSVWTLWLLILGVQNRRISKLSYPEASAPQPRRAVRGALTWAYLMLVSRMLTLAGLGVLLLKRIPSTLFNWTPYDPYFLTTLQGQSSWILWLSFASILFLLRLFRVGLASNPFDPKWDVVSLSCWLERRSGWLFLIPLVCLLLRNFPWAMAFSLLLYLFFEFLSFPFRLGDIWKAKGRYKTFFLLPGTLLMIFLGVAVHQRHDLVILVKIGVPAIQAFMANMWTGLWSLLPID